MSAKREANKQAEALLRPVFAAMKRNAAAAILSAQEDIRNVLRVDYNAPAAARQADLPAPRLQLRCEETQDGMWQRVWHYELVFPLHEHDCRNDGEAGYVVVQLGRTRQGGANRDWNTVDLSREGPYRDGAHAEWDSIVLGGLPVYIIAPNGRAALAHITPEGREMRRKQVEPLLAKAARSEAA